LATSKRSLFPKSLRGPADPIQKTGATYRKLRWMLAMLCW
jgi:hypothetical protein